MTKQQAIEQLWMRGNLSFKLHAGQKLIDEAYNAIQGKLFVGLCSRRYGKTYWSVVKAIEKAIKTPKARIKICSQFQKDIEEIITPIINDVMSDIPAKIKPSFNSSKKKFKFKNGAEIALVGLDKNPNGLRGQFISLCIIDESFLIDNLNYLYSSVIIPATMYQEDAKVIMISTPGLSTDCDFYQMCSKSQVENAFVKFTIHDNPMVNAAMIAEFQKECLTDSDFKREYLCEWVTDTNFQIIPEWKPEFVQAVLSDDLTKYYRKYISFDIGVVDKTAFIYGYYDWKNQKLVIEHESELQGTEVTTSNINAQLGLHNSYIKPFRTVADNNNLILLQDLNSAFGKSVIGTSKDLLIAMVSELRILIKEGRLLVNPSCKQLINQLENGLWDKNKKAFRRTQKHHQDHLAALIYLVRNLSEFDNPIPATHNASIYTHYIPQDEEQTQTVESFKKIFNVRNNHGR